MIHNYPYDTEPAVNSQLTKKFFIKSEHSSHIDITTKIDHITDHAIMNTKAYEPFFSKFDHYELIFKLQTLKEGDTNYSHEVKLKSKFAHTYTYSEII